MATQPPKLRQREVAEIMRHLEQVGEAKKAGALDKVSRAAESLATGLPAQEGDNTEEQKLRVRLIEALARLDKTDQLRSAETSRFAREMRQADASVYKSTVTLAVGEASARAGVDKQKIAETAQLHDQAQLRKQTSGWEWATDWDDQIVADVGKFHDFFDHDLTGTKTATGRIGFSKEPKPDFRKTFIQQVSNDLLALNDREAAFYLASLKSMYGFDFGTEAVRADSEFGPQKLGAVVSRLEAAANAEAQAKAVDRSADRIMEQTTRQMLSGSGSTVLRAYDRELNNLRKALTAPQDLSVGTTREPPPEDAPEGEKKKWVEDYTYGKMTISPEDGTIVPVDPDERETTRPVTYSQMFDQVDRSRGERPYAESAKDHIEQMLDELSSEDASARELQQKFREESRDFKNYKASRGYQDEELAYKAYIAEARARHSANKLTDKEIRRQAVLSGQADATAGQYRRAALGAFLTGPGDSKTIGRDPLGTAARTLGKAVAAPIVLPAAALAGGVKGLRSLAKRKGLASEATEAEPEAPEGDTIAQRLSELRDMADQGIITEEQLRAVEAAFDKIPQPRKDEAAPTGRTIEFSEGDYNWRVTLDENDKPVGEAEILEGSRTNEGKRIEIAGKFGSIITKQVEEAIEKGTATVVSGPSFGEEPVGEDELTEEMRTGVAEFEEETEEQQQKRRAAAEEQRQAEVARQVAEGDLPDWVAPTDPAQKRKEAEAKGVDLQPEGKVRVDPMQAELRQKQVVALTEAALTQGIIDMGVMNKILNKFEEDSTIPVLGEGNSLQTALFQRATPEQQESLKGAVIAAQNLEKRAQEETAGRAKQFERDLEDEAQQRVPAPVEGTEEFGAYSERLREEAGETGEKLISEIKAQKDREALLRELKRPEGLEEMTEKEYREQKRGVKKAARQVKRGAKKVEKLETKVGKPRTKKKAEKKKEKEQKRAQRKFYKGKPSARR